MTKVTIARTERAADEQHEMEYGGETFLLPPTLPLAAVEAIESGSVTGFIRGLFGEKQYVKLRRLMVDAVSDLEAMSDALTTLYGVSPGERRASGDS